MCGKVHEGNLCTCGHPYHGHCRGVSPELKGCLNCRCGQYVPDGETYWTAAPAPKERPPTPRRSDDGEAPSFEKIMRRVRSLTPDERVLMAADTELAIANARILGEGLVRDLEDANAKLRKGREGDVMDELIDWLVACLDEDELWATEASRKHGEQPHPGGVHWQWVEPETDTSVEPDPSRGGHLTDDAGNFRFALHSVEHFPTEHVGPLPLFAIPSAEEIAAAVAGHIVRHDPARVLADITSKWHTLTRCREALRAESPTLADFARQTLWDMAQTYRNRPGFRASWRPAVPD